MTSVRTAQSSINNDDTEVSSQSKHLLETKWCFWLRNSQGGRNNEWSQQQTLGHTFDTVEDFWRMINNIHNPFEGNNNNIDYSIFRESLIPDYDESCFKDGGRIILKLPGGGSRTPHKHFEVWVHLLLALIGENFDDMGGEYVGGLRLVAKRGTIKLEVWTKAKDTAKMEPLTRAVAQLVSPLLDHGRLSVDFESFDKSVSLKVQC